MSRGGKPREAQGNRDAATTPMFVWKGNGNTCNLIQVSSVAGAIQSTGEHPLIGG